MKTIKRYLEIKWEEVFGQTFTLQRQQRELNLIYAENDEEKHLFI